MTSADLAMDTAGFVLVHCEDGAIWVRCAAIVALGVRRTRRERGDTREVFLAGCDRPFMALDTLDNAGLWKALSECGGSSTGAGGEVAAAIRALQGRIDVLTARLAEVSMTLEQIRASNAAILAGLGELDGALSNIAADIQRIKDAIPSTGGLTAEETRTVAEELAGLQSRVQVVVDAAKSLADSNPEPTTDTPPVV